MTKNNDNNKHLHVMSGVKQPSNINPNFKQLYKTKTPKNLSVAEYTEGILTGNVSVLSRAITLIESTKQTDQEVAQQIIENCLPFSGNSKRIGITGVPGVGKSTFIENFGTQIMGPTGKMAVLAVDPSSEQSKGSILGDKTRMEHLSNDPRVFIRPSPSSGTLGGVARKTRETIVLCEAAGYNYVLIETVGVGQSETLVHSMVDFFMLLMLAGAGDELQGIKRGIMEMADAVVITKADGINVQKSHLAQREYQNALHYFPPMPSGWQPQVLTCSAIEKTGFDDLNEMFTNYFERTLKNGFFEKKRNQQNKYWLHETILAELKNSFYNNDQIKIQLSEMETLLQSNRISPFALAKKLLKTYKQEHD